MTENYFSRYNTVMDSEFYVPQSALSATTSIQTANQLAEATARLNAGVEGIDLAVIDPQLFEQIPKQHFKEINRLMKLSGAKATMHGPIVDLAGFTQQNWSDLQRQETEKQVISFMERAHDLDPDGNTPINFHVSTAAPGTQWRKVTEAELKKEGLPPDEIERIKQGGAYEWERPEMMLAVNKDTGQLQPLRYEVKKHPGGKPAVYRPEDQIEIINKSQWDNDKVAMINIEAQKLQFMDRMQGLENEVNFKEKSGVPLTYDERIQLDQMKKQLEGYRNNINTLNEEIEIKTNAMYSKLDEYGFSPDINKQLKKIDKSPESFKRDIDSIHRNFEEKSIEIDKKIYANPEREAEFRQVANEVRNDYLDKFRNVLNSTPPPQVWQKSDDVARDSTIRTVANATFASYEKYGEKSPILVLENYQPDLVLGRAEQLADVVEETRNQFANKLMQDKNVGKSKAHEIAEKLIGVTWDVGHINFMRKSGYSKKEILAETERIAPYVKQVHITDNFGFADAHLPPGMGNAPIKEELEILKKAGFKYDKGNVIVEAGSFVAQMKENPQGYVMEYFNSPLNQYAPPTKPAAPYWPQIWEQETAYGLGKYMGDTLPELHFREFYGSGFSSLPRELGGQVGGDKSRFAGTPNQ